MNRDVGIVSTVEADMPERELIQPHEKRYQRRNDGGTFSDSDDQHKSLSQDAQQHAKTKKPRNEGDKGD
ncbi:MAG: hypothetical protein ABIQ43_07330 [Sphingomonas sp.]